MRGFFSFHSCFLDEFLESGKNPDGSVPRMVFEQVSLAHPVFISYTSGTTGLPKALVHGSGVSFIKRMLFAGHIPFHFTYYSHK